jgi:aspartate kinase
MKVCKFGGSSLSDAARVARACDIVAADPERRIVVVSAPGKRSASDIKVTDLLIECAGAKVKGKPTAALLGRIVERFSLIQKELELPASVMERISGDLALRVEGPVKDKARFLEEMKAAGEDNCAWLVTAALRAKGVDAHYVSPGKAGMLLSDEYGAARVLDEAYPRLRVLRDAPGVTVFPGFFGVTRTGQTVTFLRGGSDITGAVLAAAVQADVYENFTDVDSVFTVDPRIIPSAKPIAEITYREMRELAYAGFGVFHDEAVVPVFRAGIPIHIRNTNRPDSAGTMVVTERKHIPGTAVGIAGSDGFCTVYVDKYLMNRELGFGRRLLQIFEEENLSYEHTPSGIDSMCVILAEKNFDAAVEKRVIGRIRSELQAETSVERGQALIMIVGEGLHYAIGMAARATGALAEARVNIEMLNQGSSEISMMFGVKAEDRGRALQSLYHAFFET